MRSRAVEAGERSTQGRERGSEREREKPRAFCLSMRWASSEGVLLCPERGRGDYDRCVGYQSRIELRCVGLSRERERSRVKKTKSGEKNLGSSSFTLSAALRKRWSRLLRATLALGAAASASALLGNPRRLQRSPSASATSSERSRMSLRRTAWRRSER